MWQQECHEKLTVTYFCFEEASLTPQDVAVGLRTDVRKCLLQSIPAESQEDA